MHRSGNNFLIVVLAGISLAGVMGCTPKLSPLYRDYEVPQDVEGQPVDVYEKVRIALVDAGWELAQPDVANVVKTEEQTLTNWGLYKVTAYLEAAPLGGNYVRVYIHPFRKYVTGGQSKVPFLLSSVRSRVLPPLNQALEEQGLTSVGVPRDKDQVVSSERR